MPAEVIQLRDRRRRAPGVAEGESAEEGLLRLVGESPDPTAAALIVFAGFARFLALRGVTAAELVALVEDRVAEQLAIGDPYGMYDE